MRRVSPVSVSVFQFTPLREGRRCAVLRQISLRLISIHAPPRGATYARDVIVRLKLISIHAPPRGATVHRPS